MNLAGQQISKKYTCRPFDPKETLILLRLDFWKFGSWGVSKIVSFTNDDSEPISLVLRVSGRLFKGYVSITLGGDDLYIVTLINIRGREISCTKEIYFDMLADTIDKLIETK